MKEMTREQVIEAAKKYDRIHNEGAEGYNPYWSELERRETEAAAAKPKSKKEQIAALHDKIRRECGSVAREWGGAEVNKKQTAYYAAIKNLEAEIAAEFAAEWTADETKSRRVVWNDFIKAELAGGSMTPEKCRKMHEKTTQLGWGIGELKKAVALNNLGPAK